MSKPLSCGESFIGEKSDASNEAGGGGHLQFAAPAPALERKHAREATKCNVQLASAGDAGVEEQRAAQTHIPGDLDEHRLSPSGVAARYGTGLDKDVAKSKGLTQAEATARLAKHGPNALTPPPGKSAFRRYLECLLSLFNILLILCGILEYILLGVDFEDNKPNEYLGAILIAVAFINAGIEFYQLQKSANILASFLKMVPPEARVIRDGVISTIEARNLVQGDLITIQSGDKTQLTQFCEPQTRIVLPEGTESRAVEAENLIFNSSLVCNGEGLAIVVRTGDATFIGSIAHLTGGENAVKSPLGKEIDSFVLIISGIAIFTAILFFIVGITTTYKGEASQTVTFAISILVAWVPQGLPATVTLLLSIAAQRMARENVLVKDLQGVETLGSLTLLATDKTGTLTRNQMTVQYLWTNRKLISAVEAHEDVEEEHYDSNDSGIQEMLQTSIICSKIRFVNTTLPLAQREIVGDATETGLTKFAIQKEPNFDGVKADNPVVFQIPFNSNAKFAAVIVKRVHAKGLLTLFMKGAPERVLSRCDTMLIDNKPVPISDNMRTDYDTAYESIASKGHRVIACAQRLLPGDKYGEDFPFSFKEENVPLTGLCFLGLFSLQDPPKHGVREAVGELRRAGIQVLMVTGDHPLTAQSIARSINIIAGETKESLARKMGRSVDDIREDEYDAIAVHGDEIDSLESWQWDQIFSKREIVFARTSPQHKLEIVRRAQARGHIVGVTGDGVNDAPALKAANLGISMQISGSDVSKQAAKLILLDDNFASVVKGVREGRLIFANLQKSIKYTLSHIVPEVLPQILYVCVPIPLPLSAILILVIDLGFELANGLSFAFDPEEGGASLMRQMPRKPVTKRTLAKTRTRALRKIMTRTKTQDSERQIGGKLRVPTLLQLLREKLNEKLSKQYWRETWESRHEGESLVNASVLSYAYIYAGLIETMVALIAYFSVFYVNGFSPSELKSAQSAGVYFKDESPSFTNARGQVLDGPAQVDAFGQAQGIVYLSIFVMQCFNLFACKARVQPPFGRAIVANIWNFVGVAIGSCIAIFIAYTKPIESVFGCSYHLLPYWLGVPFAGGILLLIMASILVIVNRRSLPYVDDSRLGLRMHKTQYTLPKTLTVEPGAKEDDEKLGDKV